MKKTAQNRPHLLHRCSRSKKPTHVYGFIVRLSERKRTGRSKSVADLLQRLNAIERHVQTIHCSGQLEGTELRFDYSSAILTSGDVFAHGAVMNNLIEIGGTSFYAKDQLGAASAGVLFEFDVSGLPDAGFWSIALDRSTLVTVIDYMDYDLVGVRRTWTMTPEACVLNSY